MSTKPTNTITMYCIKAPLNQYFVNNSMIPVNDDGICMKPKWTFYKDKAWMTDSKQLAELVALNYGGTVKEV